MDTHPPADIGKHSLVLEISDLTSKPTHVYQTRHLRLVFFAKLLRISRAKLHESFSDQEILTQERVDSAQVFVLQNVEILRMPFLTTGSLSEFDIHDADDSNGNRSQPIQPRILLRADSDPLSSRARDSHIRLTRAPVSMRATHKTGSISLECSGASDSRSAVGKCLSSFDPNALTGKARKG